MSDVVRGALVDEPEVRICHCWCGCYRFLFGESKHCDECLAGDHPHQELGGEA